MATPIAKLIKSSVPKKRVSRSQASLPLLCQSVCMTAIRGASPRVSGTNRKWYSEVVANWTRARSTVEIASALMGVAVRHPYIPASTTRVGPSCDNRKRARSAAPPTDVGREIGQHARHPVGQSRHDRVLSIGEAVLLSIVTIVAAYSGFSAAKWGD